LIETARSTRRDSGRQGALTIAAPNRENAPSSLSRLNK
jgi:hypothetical protein